MLKHIAISFLCFIRLAAEYKNSESDVGNWIKSFFGLSYLDPNDVEDCFAFDLFPCAPNVEKAHEFADYILRNYIDENSKCPPSVWAEPDLQFKRTTKKTIGSHTIKTYSLFWGCITFAQLSGFLHLRD
jgi:hypothetical protein